MKTRYWIILFAVLLAVGGALTAILFARGTGGTVANVYRDGTCIYSVDLSRVKEPYEITFSDERGSNTVRVEPGRVRVVDADCVDRVCEKTGWITDRAAPIVCLPHRLVIRVERSAKASGGADTVVG